MQAAFPQDVHFEKKLNEETNVWIVCGSRFELDKRYEILDPMG